MNRSAGTVAEVPLGVVTVTSTVPADPAGEVTVIDVAESAVTVPATVPNLTDVAEARPWPVTVTVVPPLAGPEVGAMAVTVGGPM